MARLALALHVQALEDAVLKASGSDLTSLRIFAWLTLVVFCACEPPSKGIFGFCSDAIPDAGADAVVRTAPLTYQSDIKRIVDERCVRCHQEGGMAPFSLASFDDVYRMRALSRKEVKEGHMPPWLPASCCSPLEQDWSMPAAEKQAFLDWIDSGAQPGDLTALPPTTPAPELLGRVDVTVTMPAPYRPTPPRGKTDDTRCFVVDWPRTQDAFVTGMNVIPGNRRVVHHLLLAVVSGKDGNDLRKREGKDGQPGYDCPGGAFGSKVTRYIGGGVGGAEYPRGIGTKVTVGSKLVLQVHYSTINDPSGQATDQTSVQLRVDATAREGKAIVITNPFWIAGDAMKVKANDANAVYFYRYRPTVFTQGKRVLIEGGSPHMHAFGSRFLMGIIHADGTRECILEIPHWHFGWEQGYWLKTPKLLAPNDEVYVECNFDNSAANQPIIDGVQSKPRDFAWGGDNQDMCAGFLTFTEAP